MAAAADLPIYVINLDRSTGRWADIEADAKAHDVKLIRVSGVDGRMVERKDWADFDNHAFGKRNGRTVLPGEYGCYQSHLRALEIFLASENNACVILEDDVRFNANLQQRLHAVLEIAPDNALIKLVNHRVGGFLPIGVTRFGDQLGACAFGPQGSSAAYLVTRAAARLLYEGLKPMSLPYDVALGRTYAYGVNGFSTKGNFLPFADERGLPTVVAGRSEYHASKWKKWRRLPAYAFRAMENNRRLIHAVQNWLHFRAR